MTASPQFYEGLTSFDVDVRLLGQEVRHHAHVNLRLLLPHLGDGLRAEPVEVAFKRFQKGCAQAIAGTLGTTLGIAALASYYRRQFCGII